MHENGKVRFSWHETIMHENGKVRFSWHEKKRGVQKNWLFVVLHIGLKMRTTTNIRFFWAPQLIHYRLDAFCFSPQIFHFITNKMNHDDRNGHISRYFFHCHAMISSFATQGLQSRLLLEKTRGRKCYEDRVTIIILFLCLLIKPTYLLLT